MPTNNLIRQLPMAGRANFLPYQIGADGKPHWALPGVLAGAANAVTAPYRAMNPQDYPDFNTEQEAANLALNMLGGGGAFGRAPKNALGMNVWHGSPHKFEPTPLNDLGEFNAAKIGTGEGAQAYGHGHYTGEARGTGEEYSKMNPELDSLYSQRGSLRASKKPVPIELDNAIKKAEETAQGHLYKVDIPDEHIAQMLDWDKPLRQQPEAVRRMLEKAAPSVKTVDTMSREELINTLQYIDRNGSYTDEMMINEFGRPATLDELRESARSMDVDEYLADNMVSDKHATGESAYKQLVAKFGGGENTSTIAGQAKASELLKNAGIPGIRYLDAGSRGAEGGTSNFVVFPGNEHMMTILERNGQRRMTEGELRHQTAQRNAALPVEQGGLGLSAGNTADERAAAQEWDTNVYHGAKGGQTSLTPARVSLQSQMRMEGTHTAVDPEFSNLYAQNIGDAVYPLVLRGKTLDASIPVTVGSPEYKILQSLLKRGEKPYLSRGGAGLESDPMMAPPLQTYMDAAGAAKVEAILKNNDIDNVKYNAVHAKRNVGYQIVTAKSPAYLTSNPDNIRSRFAAFDPFRRNAAIAAAMGVAAPDLLAGEQQSPESQAIARYREIKGPKSVVRMEAALRTAGVPLPKNEPVAYIQSLVDRAHRRN